MWFLSICGMFKTRLKMMQETKIIQVLTINIEWNIWNILQIYIKKSYS